MPLAPAFSTSQPAGDASVIIITDDSTGTDVTITKRRVYLLKNDGTYLVPVGTITDYVEWDNFPATTTIQIDALDKDYALNVTVQWLTSANAVVTSTDDLILCKRYADLFSYNLIDMQAGNDKLITHANYYLNEIRLNCSIQEAVKAVLNGKISSSQAALERAKKIMDKQSNFF